MRRCTRAADRCTLRVCCTAAGSSSGYRSLGHASSSRMEQAPRMSRSSYAPASQTRLVVGVDVAPSGCAPNAYKLFVGNIPRAYSEPDLLPVSALRA